MWRVTNESIDVVVLENEVDEEEEDKEDLKVNRLMTDRVMKLIDVTEDIINGKLKLLRTVPERDEPLYRALARG